MTTTNIQAKIPLKGKGFVFKAEGNYASGEYRRFNNVEFNTDGSIVNRNNILAAGKNTNSGQTAVQNSYGIVGNVTGYTITASKTEQYAVSADECTPLWGPNSLPVGAYYHRIAGVFQYNGDFYWLTVQKQSATTYDINIYHTTNKPASITAVTFANLTLVKAMTLTANSEPPITSFFIHKDRLWFSTDTTVYFSRATDPTVWTVPDGGFFKIPDQIITYCFSLSDTIYVLCDNSIYVLTYSLDVNEDGYLRMISNNMGGEYGCIHQSQPLIVNKYGIYSINSGSVTKLVDTKFDAQENTYSHKLVSFERNLILIRRTKTNYGDGSNGSGWYFNTSDSDNGYNVFVINSDSGSISVLDFTDQRDGTPGYIIDAVANPYKDTGSYRLVLLTANAAFTGSHYVMNAERDGTVYDEARLSDGTVTKYKPRIEIEVDSYTPDGSEYMMKKFRNLLLMGKFPSSDFELSVAFDNNDYNPSVDLNDAPVGHGRPHFPHRFGLYQRGHAMNVKINTKHNDDPIIGIYDQLEWSDAHVFWTYTSRSPEQNNPSLATA